MGPHKNYGITDKNLRNDVRNDRFFAEHQGTSRISKDIARKLHILAYYPLGFFHKRFIHNPKDTYVSFMHKPSI
jgi:hypothetical protein